jgi:hypothetical protein
MEILKKIFFKLYHPFFRSKKCEKFIKLLTSKMKYIIDASVFSEISDGNTEFPTLILAEYKSKMM